MSTTGRLFCKKHPRKAPTRTKKGTLYCPECKAIHLAAMPRPGRPKGSGKTCTCGTCGPCRFNRQTWEEFVEEIRARKAA